MKIGIFTQNVKQGGLDTFLLNLVSHWPHDDEILLFCNRSHPGLPNLRKKLAGKARIVAYDFWIAQDLHDIIQSNNKIIRFFFRLIFWLFGFIYLVFRCRSILVKSGCDNLLVVNGSYPGGDACLAATVAWRISSHGRRCWHNFHSIALPYPAGIAKRIKEKTIDALVLGSAKGFLSVSNACLYSLAKQRPKFANCTKAMVYNGVTVPSSGRQSQLRSELGLPPDSQIVLMLGPYLSIKGHDIAIRIHEHVVEDCPNAWLLAFGDGSSEELKIVETQRLRSHAGAQVILEKHRTDVGNILADSDILIMPSQSQEAFGYSAAEAMGVGLPVVVSRVGGLPEVVEDGVSGYVAAHDDIEGFADRVVELLQDGRLRKQIGRRAKQRVETKFSPALMARSYCKLMKMS